MACGRLCTTLAPWAPSKNGDVRQAVRASSALRAKDRDVLGGRRAEPSSARVRDLSNRRGTRSSRRVWRSRAVVLVRRDGDRWCTPGRRATARCDERGRRVRGTRRRLATGTTYLFRWDPRQHPPRVCRYRDCRVGLRGFRRVLPARASTPPWSCKSLAP